MSLSQQSTVSQSQGQLLREAYVLTELGGLTVQQRASVEQLLQAGRYEEAAAVLSQTEVPGEPRQRRREAQI